MAGAAARAATLHTARSTEVDLKETRMTFSFELQADQCHHPEGFHLSLSKTVSAFRLGWLRIRRMTADT
jgi:hypothetical protein